MSPDVVIAIGTIGLEHYVLQATTRVAELLDDPRRAPNEAARSPPTMGGNWKAAVRGTTWFGPRTLRAALRRIEDDLDPRRSSHPGAAHAIELAEIWRDGRLRDASAGDFLQQCLPELGLIESPTLHLQTP